MLPWQSEVLAVLTMDLADLVRPEARVSTDQAAQTWRLPESDRDALRRWGLPKEPVYADPQSEPDPTLTAHPTDDHERHLVPPGTGLYRIGWWDNVGMERVIGVVPESGRVCALRERPLTTDQLPVGVRPFYPDLYSPAVQLVNSSVASYVEISWRWHAAVQLLRAVEDAPERRRSGMDNFHDMVQCARDLLEGFVLIDPAMTASEPPSVWVKRILEDG